MSDTTTKRHPIRGFIYGIFFGLGLALVAVGQSWAALGTWPPFILFIIGLIVGTLWATFGPAKKPKGSPEPLAAEPEPVMDPEADPEPEVESEADPEPEAEVEPEAEPDPG